MIRFLLIALGTFSLAVTDLDSASLFRSRIFPAIGYLYMMFIMLSAVFYLHSRGINPSTELHHEKGEVINLLLAILIRIHDDKTQTYQHSLAQYNLHNKGLEEGIAGIDMLCGLYAMISMFMLIGTAITS